MVIFRCKRSGNTISFTNDDDIAGLRTHEGYEEVPENEVSNEKTQAETHKEEVKYDTVITAKAFKKLGRPPKK